MAVVVVVLLLLRPDRGSPSGAVVSVVLILAPRHRGRPLALQHCYHRCVESSLGSRRTEGW